MARGQLEIFSQFIIYSSLIFSLIHTAEGNPRIDNFENENLIEYQYRYAVDESKSKGPVMDRWEHRIGEYVKGAYSVVDPDGRVRTVDYEVDGKKGYHAVIRMNEPSSDLLSYQQLHQSFEVYPQPVLASAQFKTPSRNQSPPDITAGKAWNYHSDEHSGNGQKTNHKSLEINVVPKKSRTFENLPLSPSNFNVPQTTNVIYYKTPVASIFQQKSKPFKSEEFLYKNFKRESRIPAESNNQKEIPVWGQRHYPRVPKY